MDTNKCIKGTAPSKNGRNSTNPKAPENFAREAARLPRIDQIKLHSEDGQYVEKAIKRIGPALDKVIQDHNWHASALKAHFDVRYYPAAYTFSRLISGDAKRKMTAEQLIELRRVSGISLDKLADGCDPFDFQQMSDARLVELVEQISAELARRLRQQ